MSRILELTNGDNFSLKYVNSIPPTVIEMVEGRNIYARLTEVIIPILFDKNILLFNISTSVPVGKIWRYAGRCRQILPTGLGDAFASDKTLFLNKRNLLLLPEITSDYTINYLPPAWFIDVSITIYQYDGTDTNDISNQLNSIEAKIDAL